MGLYKNSDRVWVPGLDKVQGIVIEEHKSMTRGMSYTVQWTDNSTLLSQDNLFTEVDLSAAQASDTTTKALTVGVNLDEIEEIEARIERRWRRKLKRKLAKKLKNKIGKKSRSKR